MARSNSSTSPKVMSSGVYQHMLSEQDVSALAQGQSADISAVLLLTTEIRRMRARTLRAHPRNLVFVHSMQTYVCTSTWVCRPTSMPASLSTPYNRTVQCRRKLAAKRGLARTSTAALQYSAAYHPSNSSARVHFMARPCRFHDGVHPLLCLFFPSHGLCPRVASQHNAHARSHSRVCSHCRNLYKLTRTSTLRCLGSTPKCLGRRR